MKKSFKNRMLVLAAGMAVLFTGEATAQFTVSGEFRPRTEYNHGTKSLAGDDQDASIFTSQRTRLNLIYSSEKVKTKLVLQDVRIFGNQAQLVGNESNATSVHEAWGEVLFTPEFSLKIGRQEVIYDDHRIFGNVGWAQQARSHDIAIFKYEGGIKAHLGIAHNSTGSLTNPYYITPDAYKDMQYLWLNNSGDSYSGSILVLNKSKDNADTSDVVSDLTIGPRVTVKAGPVDFAGYFYFQTSETISAFDLGLEATMKVGEKSKATLGYELLTGNDPATTDKNEAFNPFFGTNHKFNGFMDYFYVGNHANSVGLSDVYVKGVTKVGAVNLTGFVHFFSAAVEGAGFDGKGLGTEIDLVAAYKVTDGCAIAAGYSQMFGTDNMVLLKGGSTDAMSNWAWLMITFTPTFLNQ